MRSALALGSPPGCNALGPRETPEGATMLRRGLILLASLALMGAAVVLAPSADQPAADPGYQPVAAWPRLPAHLQLGEVTAVATDSADRVYVFHRGKVPVVVFDPDGTYLGSWGEGWIKVAHGLRIDRDDNVWLTDLG